MPSVIVHQSERHAATKLKEKETKLHNRLRGHLLFWKIPILLFSCDYSWILLFELMFGG